MAWIMDQEIQKMIMEAETRATGILEEKRQVLDALAEALLKEEMLERVDVELIIKNAQGESKRT